MSQLMKVSSNPHIRSHITTSNIMLAVIIALLPAAGFGIYNFVCLAQPSVRTDIWRVTILLCHGVWDT